MDPRSQEYLEKILKKELNILTEDDKAFLRARRSYLNKAQLEEYDSILNPKTEETPIYVSKKDRNQTSEAETVKENGEP